MNQIQPVNPANQPAAANQVVQAISLSDFRVPNQIGGPVGGPVGLAIPGIEQLLIENVNNTYPDQDQHPNPAPLNRLKLFVTYLSQALSSSPTQNKDLVVSALKTNFLALAKTYPMTAKNVLEEGQFSNSELKGIKELKEKVEYYNSCLVSKFIHHIQGRLRSNNAASGKAFLWGSLLLLEED